MMGIASIGYNNFCYENCIGDEDHQSCLACGLLYTFWRVGVGDLGLNVSSTSECAWVHHRHEGTVKDRESSYQVHDSYQGFCFPRMVMRMRTSERLVR